MTIFNTKGIVLRTVKYGETSVITTILTELFGVKSYIVNGVRSGGKTSKAHFYQPASLLEMQVYNNDLKNLQRVKEVRWSYIFREIYADVIKNTIALYMVELLSKSVQQPEANEELFFFCEHSLMQLDSASKNITANFALHFSIHLPRYLGFQIRDNYSAKNSIFDIREGAFGSLEKVPPQFANEEQSEIIHLLLSNDSLVEGDRLKLYGKKRTELLEVMQEFYQWHVPDMGSMQTLPILTELFS